LEGPDSIAKKLKECPSIICVGGVSSINWLKRVSIN
jgi:hypothetical protein